MAVIAILSAILLPALGAVLRSGEQAESLNRMRQIGQWMQLYAQDSNDVVLPSGSITAVSGFLESSISAQRQIYSRRSASRTRHLVRHPLATQLSGRGRLRRIPAGGIWAVRVRTDSMVWNDPNDTGDFGALAGWDDNPLRSRV